MLHNIRIPHVAGKAIWFVSLLSVVFSSLLVPSLARAQTNIALSAIANHSGGGAGVYAPSNYNDNVVAASTGCTSSAEPWGWVLTSGWITLTWPSAVSFNKIVLYKSNRPMTTCTMEYWDGAAFVPFLSYSGTTCAQDSVIFAPVTTTILRLNNIAGSSNPNHREIKVYSNVTPPPAITGSAVYCVGQTISLSASSAVTGPVYTWSGPAGFSATGPSISIPGVTLANAGTYSCVVTPSAGGAASAPSVVTVTVNPLPSAISGIASLCAPGTTVLTCSPAGGTWSGSNASIATVAGAGTTGTVSGVSVGTANISYIMGGGCFSIQAVTVSAAPTATVVTTPASFCSGGSATLSALVPTGTNIFTQNFNSGLGAWSVSSTAGSIASFWQVATSPAWGGVAGDGTNMVQAAADAFASVTSTSLVSPVFSMAGYTAGTLSCNQFYNASAGDASVNIEYSINGGSSWNTLTSLTGTSVGGFTWSSASPTSTYTLPGAMMGQPNCRLRWNYVSTAGMWWALDNISLTGLSPASASVSWSPTATLFTDAGLTVPYTGSTTSVPVFAAPVATLAPVAQTYTATVTSGGCVNNLGIGTVTVNPIPAAIAGPGIVCAGSTISLTTATLGGSWISGSANATVVGAGTTCTVSGVSAGTATISYVVGSGCLRTTVITVNPLPAVITGAGNVCVGASVTLTNTTPFGIWTSANLGIATVEAATGLVTGMIAGSVQISYTTPEGCSRSQTMIVNPLPATISGPAQLCTGSSAGYSSSPTSGAWLASNSNVTLSFAGSSATVDGVTAGTSVISYVLGTGCYATKLITINSTPAATTGPSSVCIGSVITLGNTTTGGTWLSQNVTLASVDGGGNVTGISAGSLVISYVTGAGCFSIRAITVNALPAVLSGTGAVCTGASMLVSSSPSGGVWSADNANVSISFSGTTCTVNGVVAGTSTLSYMLGTGCYRTGVVTINETPADISGPATVCEGAFAAYGTITPGGIWVSSNVSAGTINAGGLFTAISAGTTTLSYVTAAGCYTTKVITVNAQPAAVSGILAVCTGGATILSSVTGGGSWAASNTLVALSASGSTCTVSGATAGTSVISYTLATGCRSTAVVTINESPAAIGGPSSVCVGSNITLTQSATGGMWVSGNTAIATIDAAGLVTGISAGIVELSYVSGSGCYAVASVTVNAAPAAITGTSIVCTGSTTTLSSTGAGGIWSSGSASVSLSPAGTICTVSGIAAGTAIVSYTSASGCSRLATVTVNETPAAISGTLALCAGSTTLLTNATAGGSWVSSGPSVATISGSGMVNGVSAGTATVSYTLATGCAAVAVFTVNATPAPVSGALAVCTGNAIVLTTATTGGTWGVTGTAASVAPAGSSCTVNGLVAGTATVSYVLSTGCYSSAVVTVNLTPAMVVGPSAICVAATAPFTNATFGGSWMAGSTATATVDVTGIVTGISAGTAVISYVMPSGCFGTASLVVNPIPAAIAIPASVCEGAVVVATNSTSGGTWSATGSGVALASAGTSCSITGVSAGTAMVSYTLGTGCYSTVPFTVLVQPGAITGAPMVAPSGGTTVLSSSPAGGTWASSNADVATVGSGTGIVTGVVTGTANITYTATSGCFVTTQVTVVPLTINGPATVCAGATATYTHAVAGGTWSVSTPGIATINAVTGLLTGITGGPVTVTYTPFAGFFQTKSVLVQGVLPVIGGATAVCEGATAALTSTPASGTWQSADTTIATINSALAIATGVSTGVVTITYTVGTCYATRLFTVHPAPAPITGSASVCVGATVALSSATMGGAWSVSGSSVSITTTGMLSGISVGSGIVSYTTAVGCRATMAVSINALPNAISGTTSLCAGSTSLLGSGLAPLSWSSSNPLVATVSTVTATSSVAMGVGVGTSEISVYNTAGCVRVVTVSVTAPLPAIEGATVLCPGGAVALSNSAASGTWSSSNTARATVGVYTGVVTGVSAGSVVITYATAPTCFVTMVVTVNAVPDAITGTTTVCAGSQTVLTHSVSGGTWSSASLLAASVGSSDGIVTGISAGTSLITYRISEGCFRTIAVSVNAAAPAIAGAATACEGTTITLTNTAAGTWTSGDTSVATIPTSPGIVTGVVAGTAVISFRVNATGCIATRIVTVNTTPTAIEGSNTLCVGSAGTYVSSPTGGTWSSSTVGVVGIGTTYGDLVAISAGTVTVTYMLNGCRATKVVTAVALPASISGALTLCTGATTTLSCSSAGLVWGTSASDVATVSAATTTTGLVTGVAGGTAAISYTNSLGCARVVVVTVTASPSDIVGIDEVCIGGTAVFSNAVAGGSWSSSTPAIASVTLSGIVSGVSGGTATITYRTSSTCFITKMVTVIAAPTDAITGPSSICVGSTVALDHASVGGVWSCNTPTRATIDMAGNITGIATGTATVTYTISESCFRTLTVTVQPLPAPPAGLAAVCQGGSVTLTNSVTGGTWSSANDVIATVGATTGVVTGLTDGVVNITYKLTSTGCFTVREVTVNPLPSITAGMNPMCTGATDVWSALPVGGIWASSASPASVGSATGVVAANFAGTSVISYTLPTGCRSTVVATVNAQPAAITGTLVLCIGSTTTLSSATGGQTWSSSMTSVATVGSASSLTGLVTGITPGTAVVSYTNAFGCYRTVVVTVTASPTDIVGDDVVCLGGTTTMTNPLVGGTWSVGSSNATVGVTTGVVTGVSIGLARITYRIGAACYTTKLVTVTAVTPDPISGPSSVCPGASMTLTHSIGGGTWVSANTGRATVGATTGVVTGVTSGSVIISYFITSGCFKTATITVSAPTQPINGPLAICEGNTGTLTCASSGGSWASSDVSVAAIGSGTGVVTGLVPGTAMIVYTLLVSGCQATRVITVNPLPTPIAGVGTVCVGATTTLSSMPAGGTWVTSAGIYATVDAATGIVTGITGATTARITYTLPTSCRVWQVVTINSIPATINGTAAVTVPGSTTLTCATMGGTWASSDVTKATIGTTTGVMTGVAAGTVTITYQLSATGCFRTRAATVNPASPRPQLEEQATTGIHIYPSPTNGLLNIDYSHDGTLELYTADGRIVATYAIHQPQTAVLLPGHLAAGVYMCRFTGEDGQIAIVRIVYTP